MFEKDSERSWDLEWRLTSGQEDEEGLVKFLVEDQYERVLRLCLIVWGDPIPARQAVQQTLATAAGKAYQFTGRTSAQAWLYRLALETCRNLHSPPVHKAFLARYLQQDMDLSIDEIAYVLKVPQSRVRVELERTGLEGPDSGGANQEARDTFSLPALSPLDERLIEEEILRLIQQASRRRRLSARLQEAALFSLGLLLAIVIGRAAFTSRKAADSPTDSSQPAAIATQDITRNPANQSPAGTIQEREIIYFAKAGDTLTSIAEITGSDIDRLLLLNEIPPEKPLQPGQPVVIALVTPDSSLITPTPVTPAPLPEPLTLQSSPDSIRQRILDSHHYWNTLWAEAATIDYGPPGYIGPPKEERQQVWISQPDRSLTLSASLEGDVALALLSSQGRVVAINYSTGGLYQYGRESLVDTILPVHELLLPTRMRTSFEEFIEVIGAEAVAGRETLVMDWFVTEPEDAGPDDPRSDQQLFYQSRFWVDTRTGVILRRQWYDQKNPGLLEKEVIVREIQFDLPISNQLFDPLAELPTRLARNGGATPAAEDTLHDFGPQTRTGQTPIPRRSLPDDLDLSRSSLQFQWTSLAELDPSQPTRADVFADGYYLGNVDFGDPRSLSCLRSPDGKLIAYTEWFEEPPYGAKPLRWFSLESLQTVYEPMPDLISGYFAFSPDSRRLALFACTRSLQGCGIHILDLETGHYRQLVEMTYAGSLGWRPDGEQLAFRGAKKAREETSLWVVDASSGEIIYHGPLVPESGQPAGKSPLPGWGAVLQRTRRGVEGCSQPPGG